MVIKGRCSSIFPRGEANPFQIANTLIAFFSTAQTDVVYLSPAKLISLGTAGDLSSGEGRYA